MRFSDLWTEKDGDSLDIKRVLVIPVALISPQVLVIYAIHRGQALSMVDYCTGMATIVGAIGALLALHAWSKGENGPAA